MKPPITITIAFALGPQIAWAIWPHNAMNIALVAAGMIGGVWLQWLADKFTDD